MNVLLAPNAMQRNQEDYLHAGIDDFRSEPIRPEHLHAMLKEWLFTLHRLYQNNSLHRIVRSFVDSTSVSEIREVF